MSSYHQKIIDYYDISENAYIDSWDLKNSLSIHYGFWDKEVRSFPESLLRMNAVMAEKANLTANLHVLDAGCGIGGSSIWLASSIGCRVTGISLSSAQIGKATKLAQERDLSEKISFEVQNYCATSFPDQSFDAVWGLESICYADDKEAFIKEAFRLLKPGGKLVLADGMVTQKENNQHPLVRKWLDGWVVNYLETSQNWKLYAVKAGFSSFIFYDITRYTKHSSRRLFWFSLAAYVWAFWKKYIRRKPWNKMQMQNIDGAFYQYLAMRKKLWQYGLFVATK